MCVVISKLHCAPGDMPAALSLLSVRFDSHCSSPVCHGSSPV